MARKFIIEEEDFNITKSTQKENENTNAKEIVSENTVATESKDELKNTTTEAVNSTPKNNNCYEPAESDTATTSVPVASSLVPTEIMTTTKNDDYVRIRVTGLVKNEAKSVRKQILLKPSVGTRVEEVLKKQYQGLSFNNLVNQLLEGWLIEVDSVDVDSTDKQ